MKYEHSIIILTKKYCYILEWWTSSQYKHCGLFKRTICWILGLLCFPNNSRYPRIHLVIQQMYPGLDLSIFKNALIVIKRNPQDETNIYHIMYANFNERLRNQLWRDQNNGSY